MRTYTGCAVLQHGLRMDAAAALRGARAMAVAELAVEPRLRDAMRDLFYNNAAVSTGAPAEPYPNPNPSPR